IACLRSLGFAARYVSGYLETRPPGGQTQLVGATASHAWVSVYCPDLGWVEFDPTNNLLPSGHHIVVAWGRDYSDVTPLKGTILGGVEHELQVSVEVTRIEDIASQSRTPFLWIERALSSVFGKFEGPHSSVNAH